MNQPNDDEPPKPTLLQQAKASPITAAIMAINIAWFLVAELTGKTTGEESGFFNKTTNPQVLLQFGAVEPLHVGAGQYWRMASYMFLHIGIIHLLWNTWAGASWCASVERVLGRWRFLVIYLATGIGGGAASVFFSPAISAGASGAMFGMVGATLAIRRRQLPSFKYFTADPGVRATVGNIVLWTIIGIVAMPMNHYAHFGGLIVGIAATLVATSRAPRAPKWIAFGVVFVALVALAALNPLMGRRGPLTALDGRGAAGRTARPDIDFTTVTVARSRYPIGKDPQRVIHASPSACKAGVQRACVVYGASLMSSEKQQDMELALSLLHNACVKGEPDGCAGEGDIYLSGIGVTQDIDKGRKLGREACAQGSEWGCELDPLKGLDLLPD